MNKCIKCKSRKGKRYCSAFSGLICSLCCGKYREKEINCPESCIYLLKHRSYQEKKEWIRNIAKPEIIEKKQGEIYEDKKFMWLTFYIEKMIVDFASNHDITDRKVIKTLEYVLDKLKKEKSLIYMGDKDLKEKDELGEVIYNSIKNIRYPREIIVPESIELYNNEEKIKCIENLIFSAKLYSKGELDGKNYINFARQRVEKIIKESGEKKIIIPR